MHLVYVLPNLAPDSSSVKGNWPHIMLPKQAGEVLRHQSHEGHKVISSSPRCLVLFLFSISPLTFPFCPETSNLLLPPLSLSFYPAPNQLHNPKDQMPLCISWGGFHCDIRQEWNWVVFSFLPFVFSWDKNSRNPGWQARQGWPWTSYPPVSIMYMLGLQAYITMPSFAVLGT